MMSLLPSSDFYRALPTPYPERENRVPRVLMIDCFGSLSYASYGVILAYG